MNFAELLDTSCSGIWGLVNEADRKIYLSYSNNILSSISRNISDLKSRCHSCRDLNNDLSKLSIIIVERNTPSSQLKLSLSNWMDNYRNNNYGLYREFIPVSYKLRKVVSKDYLVHVLLVNSRNDKIVVGIFDKMDLADQFINTHYKDNITKVIYSDNQLTGNYIKRMGNVV